MCLHPQAVPPVPEDTSRIARAAFRKGNLFMRMRDEFGAIYSDEDFAPLFSTRGQSAESPWRLALVTVMQHVEGLSDEQVADAVRGHIDWKSPSLRPGTRCPWSSMIPASIPRCSLSSGAGSWPVAPRRSLSTCCWMPSERGSSSM